MLKIFDGERLIFSSQSKWLHPIFEFEDFLADYDGPKDNFRAWDSAIGKAAAVLLIRLGVKQLHGELVSELAVKYTTQTLGEGKITWDTLVDRLMCQTESILNPLSDADERTFHPYTQGTAAGAGPRPSTRQPTAVAAPSQHRLVVLPGCGRQRLPDQ